MSFVIWAGGLSLSWQGQRGGPARGPWPQAAGPEQAKDSLSRERSSPGLQLLLLGGAGEAPLCPLSPGVSTPKGTQPWRPSGPSELVPPSVHLPQRPEKMSQVLGKRGSSWGPGPRDPNYFWSGVCPLEDSLPFPPSHSGRGRLSRFLSFPHSFPHDPSHTQFFLKGL